MFTIRNDDVAYDTTLQEIKSFCEICDRYDVKIIQAITLVGECQKSHKSMTNEQILLSSFRRFDENPEVLNYLKSRMDDIAVHGLWHTHSPSENEVKTAAEYLKDLGLTPTYFVPPFNEGQFSDIYGGLKTCQLNIEDGDRLEDYLKHGVPMKSLTYLHSWRFDNKWYTFQDLDNCLKRITSTPIHEIKKISNLAPDDSRLWYNRWISVHAEGKVLDVGKSQHWDYGYPTIDINPALNPTYVGNIEHTDLPGESFDTVLCNGMYEFVENPQAMINETLRIVKRGGNVIFGFVGKGYKPYKDPWKFYEGNEIWPRHTRLKYVQNFDDRYHFLVVKRI